MPRAKATGGRDSPLRLKRITDERNEVGWRTNGGLRRKKEKREKEG